MTAPWITAKADDRFRIFIDGETVLHEWDTGVKNKTYGIQRELGEGTHQVSVEYRELVTNANITTTISPLPLCSARTADYYATHHLTGPVAWTECWK